MTLVVVWSGDVARRVAQLEAGQGAALRSGMSRLGDIVEQEVVRLTGSTLGASVSTDVEADAVTVGSDAPLAAVIESGRQPGVKPPEYAVGGRRAALRIASRGSRALKPFENARGSVATAGNMQDVLSDILVDLASLSGRR